MMADTSQKRTLLVMLCGIPGSGKSSVAAELVRRLGDVEIIATDVIGGRGGRYRKLCRRVDGLAGRRRFIILDGTFFARAMREHVRQLGYPVLLVFLECPLEVCLERNRGRRSVIPEKGVRGMARRFEAPTADEAPLVIRSDRIPSAAAAARIHRAVTRRSRMLGDGEEGREVTW